MAANFPNRHRVRTQIGNRLGRTTIMAAVAAAIAMGGCGSDNQKLYTMRDDSYALARAMLDDGKLLIQKEENIAILLLGGAGSAYTRCAEDDAIASHFEGHKTFPRDFDIGVGTLGSPVTHFAVAATGYMYGLAGEDDHTKNVWLSTIEALSLSGIITTGLKVAVQDHSPNGEPLAWPSGHTSSTVAIATVMNDYYGPLVGVPLYMISGLVMWERMDNGEHWASDIIFGAAIGFTAAHTVTGKWKPKLFDMDVVPYIGAQSGATGVALIKQF